MTSTLSCGEKIMKIKNSNVSPLSSAGLLLCLSFLLIASGCAGVQGAKTNKYSPLWAQLSAGSSIYVSHLTDSVAIKNNDIGQIEQVLAQEISAIGHEVSFGAGAQEDSIYAGSVVSAEYELQRYRTEIKKNPGSAMYIFPEVKDRLAVLEGKLAKWDGVVQEFKMVGGHGIGVWSGNQPAFSLMLKIFNADGKWLMTSYGGISLPVYAHMATHEVRRKKNLFEHQDDAEALIRGVKKAIQPLNIAN